jgi:glutamate-1-semialdehyde aminotransferase
MSQDERVSSEVLKDILARQLKLMEEQLTFLKNGSPAQARGPGPPKDAPLIAEAPGPSVAPVAPVTRVGDAVSTAAKADPGLSTERRLGPWKPIERARGESLSGVQRDHLERLITRLNERTPESKRSTQAHRQHLADPRTVAGFRLQWKEIVYPIVAVRSQGSRVWDLDGNEYIDVAMGFGVNMLGHSPPFVIDAVTEQLENGVEIGPQTPLAGEVAELLCEFTGMERVAFCNTGSEAVLAALRVARTVTGRSKVATFAGDYHGIFDEMLGTGITVHGTRRTVPVAPGIPQNMLEEVLILDYDDPSSLEAIEQHAGDLAAVVVEPVQSRKPDLQPREFLHSLRQLTENCDIPLVFDEMITGFRIHPGGAQSWFGVQADLATYGKVVAGGFPIGVVAGRARYMDALDGGMWSYGDDSVPEAGVTWFAGTFVRHPVALAASRAVLTHLKERGPRLQEELNAKTARLVGELNDFFGHVGAPLRLQHFSSFFLISFERPSTFSSLLYFHLRDRGVHITEGRSAFLSTAHSDDDIDLLIDAFKGSVTDMQEGGFLQGSAT